MCVGTAKEMVQERGTRLDKAPPARSKACTLIHHSSIRELRGLRGVTNKRATLHFSSVRRMATIEPAWLISGQQDILVARMRSKDGKDK